MINVDVGFGRSASSRTYFGCGWGSSVWPARYHPFFKLETKEDGARVVKRLDRKFFIKMEMRR